MKKITAISFLLLTAFSVFAGDPPAIRVSWPREGVKTYPAVSASFTFGSVTPGSTLMVNGIPVAVHKNGAFFAFIPFSSGTFSITYAAGNAFGSTSTVRTLEVAEIPSVIPAARFEIDENRFEPSKDMELMSGDWLFVNFKATPGMKASYRIKGLTDSLMMAEKSPGAYEGAYRITAKDKGKKMPIEVEIKSPNGKTKKAVSKGKLTVLDASYYQVVISTAEITPVKTSNFRGYDFFLNPGTKLMLQSRIGNERRAVFNSGYSGWVSVDRLSFSLPGAPPPRANIGLEIKTVAGPDTTTVLVGVDESVPFKVEETINPLSFRVSFYGASGRVNWIRYDPTDTVVKDVRWKQENTETCVLDIRTQLKEGWGYDASYAGGKFVLNIRRPPAISAEAPLRGRKIAIDAGHSPLVNADGAIGPLGNIEPDVNLAIAKKLKALLEKDGATVSMIRKSSETVSLLERPRLAWSTGADVLVSVHANSVAEEENPLDKPRGFMVFYYQPHSFSLAQSMHNAYLRFTSPQPVKGAVSLADEGFQYGDLLVPRITQMPSVLTESAYLILPEHEVMLSEPKLQELFADAMRDGLRSFFNKAAQLQASSPTERKAARKP